MGIYIKGIDMPNSGQIELTIRPHGKVFSNTKGIYAEAIQIPTPHGRLIDGDKIEAEAEQTLYGEVSYEDIAKAPTILEAEVSK